MQTALQDHSLRRAARAGLAAGLAALLAACATGPAENISLIPAGQIEAQTSKDGLFTQPVKWERKKPGCTGECPEIKVDSLVFPGMPKLTRLIDHALAVMTAIDGNQPQPYDTLAGYEAYFWKTAAPRDSAMLSARTPYRNKDLTVIELNSGLYFTGAAHGVTATQFLNWDNRRERALGLDDVLQPGRHDAFVEALRLAHARWLEDNPDARRDPAAYNRLWPFQPSGNFAFSDAGLMVKYNSYEIAPYSSGQPELFIPYSALEGILKPAYLPA